MNPCKKNNNELQNVPTFVLVKKIDIHVLYYNLKIIIIILLVISVITFYNLFEIGYLATVHIFGFFFCYVVTSVIILRS